MKKSSKDYYPPKGSILAALDIGSSKATCFIARILDDHGQFEVVGVGHQASRGIKSGGVIQPSEAEQTIRDVVNAAENMAVHAMRGYPLRDIVVNAPNTHTRSEVVDAEVSVAGQEVTENDIHRALSEAQADSLQTGRELIHTIPVNYKIDSQKDIVSPIGMHGETLHVQAHIVTGEYGPLKNMADCVDKSHLDITALCAGGYASALSCLVEDEMDLGCTLIDLGADVASIAVMQGGSLIYCDAVPYGGRHMTSDLAQGLSTSLADAERLKTLYGSAMGASTDQTEMIDVPLLGEGEGQYHHVPRSLLIGIIQPRLEEILELVRKKLQDAGLYEQVGRRVVLTGGASQMPGLSKLSQYVLDKQVRLGTPLHLQGVAEALRGPDFATVSGLLLYKIQRSHEMPADVAAQAEATTLWDRVSLWLRENW